MPQQSPKSQDALKLLILTTTSLFSPPLSAPDCSLRVCSLCLMSGPQICQSYRARREEARTNAEVLKRVLFLIFFFKIVQPSAVTINIPDPRAPCISLEMALPIVKIQNSPPSTLDMSFDFDMKTLYSQRYGQKAPTSDNHKEVFKCATQVGEEISKLIDSFILRVIDLIELRQESYLTDGENYNDANKQTNEPRRRETRSGMDPRSNRSFPGLSEGEKSHLREAIELTNEQWSFSDHWLDEQIRSDLSGGTNSTEFGDIKIRNKRDPATFISIVISLIALTATASTSLFLGARLEKLVDYVDSLSKAVEGDWQSIQVGFKNLILLKDGYGSMAAGAHYMSQTIRRLLEYNLCHIQQTRLFFEMRAIANRLDGIFESLVLGKFSTKILPLPLLKEIFSQSSIADDVLSKAVPTSFYQGASLSVLSADRAKKSVRLIFVAPRSEREPSYRVLKVHSVSSTISVNGRIFDRVFSFDADKIAIPIDLYEKHHDDMVLSAAEVQQLRIPTECSFTNGLFGCRNFLSLPSQVSSCLAAVFARDWPKMQSQCRIRMIPQAHHHPVSTSSGSTGMLLSCVSTYRLYGIDHTKSKHYQREDLTKMATRDASTSLCVWVPLHFSKIQILDDQGNRLDEIEQDTKLMIRNGLVRDITDYETKHFHYFQRQVTMDNMSLLNFTGRYEDINSHWGNIGKHDLPVFDMNEERKIFLEIGLAVVVAFILCLYLAKLAMCLRRRYARPTAGQAGRARAQITYARSASPTVTLNLPPALPPPNPNRQNDFQDDDLTEPKDRRPRGLNPPSPTSQVSFVEDCSGCPDRDPIFDPRDFVGRESHPPQTLPPKPARVQTA